MFFGMADGVVKPEGNIIRTVKTKGKVRRASPGSESMACNQSE